MSCCKDTPVEISHRIDMKLSDDGFIIYTLDGKNPKKLDVSQLGGGDTISSIVINATDGQTLFINAVPVDKTVVALNINGLRLTNNNGYDIADRNLLWFGSYNLNSSDKITLEIK